MSALGFAASMGIAGGLDNIESNYSYQEWLNKQQLLTDELRRQAEFEFQQKTAGARRQMAREDALFAAETQGMVQDATADQRAKANQEAIQFRLEEIEKLTPAEIKAKLSTEEAMQEFTRQLQEKFFKQDEEFAARKAASNQEIQQQAITSMRDYLKGLNFDQAMIDRVTVRMISDMDPLANTGIGGSTGGRAPSNADIKSFAEQQMAGLVSSARQRFDLELEARLPDGVPTGASGEAVGSDARDAMRGATDALIKAVESGNWEKARAAVNDMTRVRSPAGRAWQPYAAQLEKFFNLFDSDKHFKRIMLPSTMEELEESLAFKQANLPAFRVFEASTNATATAQQTMEDMERGLAAPGAYGPNYTPNDARTDIAGAAAEAGFNVDESIFGGGN